MRYFAETSFLSGDAGIPLLSAENHSGIETNRLTFEIRPPIVNFIFEVADYECGVFS